MDKKKQILIVTNAMTDKEVDQIKQAFSPEVKQSMDIKISIVHVIPHLPTCYFNLPSMGMLIEKYYEEARQSLFEVGKQLNIAKKDQWLITGKIRTEVLRLANKLSTDFILASAQQIQELQRSLYFKNLHQYAMIRNINQLEKI